METGGNSISSSTKVMNDIVLILETDRVMIKTFNALIANCIFPFREKFASFLQPDTNIANKLDKDSMNMQWKKD